MMKKTLIWILVAMILTVSAISYNQNFTMSSNGTTIINSWIYGKYYLNNLTTDVTDVSISPTTWIVNSTINATVPVDIINSNLTYVIFVNVSEIRNCTAFGNSTEYTYLYNGQCVDKNPLDPSNIISSNLTGTSIITNSVIHYSNVTYDPIISNSEVYTSTVNGSSVYYSLINESQIYDSTINWSTIIDSNITNAIVYNSTMINFVIE